MPHSLPSGDKSGSRDRGAVHLLFAIPAEALIDGARLALAAVAKKEYLKAADMQEFSTLRCLQPNTEFLVNEAYVGVPHFIHRLRARALAAAGKREEAKREVDFCESLLRNTMFTGRRFGGTDVTSRP